MQPFQVLWLSGIQVVEVVHFLVVLPLLPVLVVVQVVLLESWPFSSSQSDQSIQRYLVIQSDL